jgi:hypothetical protein
VDTIALMPTVITAKEPSSTVAATNSNQ